MYYCVHAFNPYHKNTAGVQLGQSDVKRIKRRSGRTVSFLKVTPRTLSGWSTWCIGNFQERRHQWSITSGQDFQAEKVGTYRYGMVTYRLVSESVPVTYRCTPNSSLKIFKLHVRYTSDAHRTASDSHSDTNRYITNTCYHLSWPAATSMNCALTFTV